MYLYKWFSIIFMYLLQSLFDHCQKLILIIIRQDHHLVYRMWRLGRASNELAPNKKVQKLICMNCSMRFQTNLPEIEFKIWKGMSPIDFKKLIYSTVNAGSVFPAPRRGVNSTRDLAR